MSESNGTPQYFRILSRYLVNGNIRLKRGYEYRTSDFKPGFISLIKKARRAQGNELVPAVEFYNESKQKGDEQCLTHTGLHSPQQ